MTLTAENSRSGRRRVEAAPVMIHIELMLLTIRKMAIMVIWNRNLATIQDRRILIMRREFRLSSARMTKVGKWLKGKAYSALKLPDISQLSKNIRAGMCLGSPLISRLPNFRRLRPTLSRRRWIVKNFCSANQKACGSRCIIRAVEWIKKCLSFTNKYSSSLNSSKALIQS